MTRISKTDLSLREFEEWPAAHSMDTCWYGVDEDGQLGMFDTGDEGLLPMLNVLGPAPEEVEDELPTTADWGAYLARYYNNPQNSPAKQLEVIGCHIYGPGFRPALGQHASHPKIHYFAPENDGYYYWQRSPEIPMHLQSLPMPLRTAVLVLKDYTFASREPVNPLDYVRGGFTWGARSTYPWRTEGGETIFPIPSLGQNWSTEDYSRFAREDAENQHPGKYWLAVDDDQHLAVFRTDRFGAVPVGAANDEHKVAIFHYLGGALKAIPQHLREQPALHWLEYPFGSIPPRMLGIYHYDASWHHPIPYCRVGVPNDPVRLDDPSWQWLEMWKPVRLPGVRFADAPLVQPLESVPCLCVSDAESDKSGGYTNAKVWIDAAMEQVHPIEANSAAYCEEGRLRRRALRYTAMVDKLRRDR